MTFWFCNMTGIEFFWMLVSSSNELIFNTSFSLSLIGSSMNFSPANTSGSGIKDTTGATGVTATGSATFASPLFPSSGYLLFISSVNFFVISVCFYMGYFLTYSDCFFTKFPAGYLNSYGLNDVLTGSACWMTATLTSSFFTATISLTSATLIGWAISLFSVTSSLGLYSRFC